MAEELIDYNKELESGKYLFKYCKFDINALQIIINKTLYFSAPDKLNDPLDSKFDLIIENPNNFSRKTKKIILDSAPIFNEEIRILLKDLGSELGNLKSQEKLFKEYFSYMQNTYSGICCFSQTHSENLLWTHYSNEAKGLCLGFDKEKLHESFQKHLKNSNYKIVHHPITYRGVKKLNVRLFKNGEISYSNYHLFSKTSHWKYEKEYRFVLEKLERTLFNLTPNRFNPFFKFDDECLRFIIVGQRIPTEHFSILDNLQKKKVFNAELLKHEFDR